MTRDVSPDLRYVRLYFTRPHKCSYLPEREAITSFVDPCTSVDSSLYSHLSRLGFRRSGKFFYAPSCGSCQACIASRIVVPAFRLSRSFRRCLNKNSDLHRSLVAKIDHREHYPLFERYITARHQDGDMYPPNPEQYMDFLGEGSDYTRYLEFRLNNKLVGCSVLDLLDDGISAIYSYFCPEEESRSPGTLAVLSLLSLAKDMHLPYVYLGYWIEGCRKMEYKNRFQPQELFIGNRWVQYQSRETCGTSLPS
jgi:arginine-tRNA-protein transferase